MKGKKISLGNIVLDLGVPYVSEVVLTLWCYNQESEPAIIFSVMVVTDLSIVSDNIDLYWQKADILYYISSEFIVHEVAMLMVHGAWFLRTDDVGFADITNWFVTSCNTQPHRRKCIVVMSNIDIFVKSLVHGNNANTWKQLT